MSSTLHLHPYAFYLFEHDDYSAPAVTGVFATIMQAVFKAPFFTFFLDKKVTKKSRKKGYTAPFFYWALIELL